jgi:hypothetical protein
MKVRRRKLWQLLSTDPDRGAFHVTLRCCWAIRHVSAGGTGIIFIFMSDNGAWKERYRNLIARGLCKDAKPKPWRRTRNRKANALCLPNSFDPEQHLANANSAYCDRAC